MKSLEILEKKLNIATELIEELDIESYDIIPCNSSKEITSVDDKKEEVFSIETLKSDFVMIRQNVMKLIATGQRILDSASLLDISDMKASQLTALSQLQQTLGNNLKMMVSIYKEISDIEHMRNNVKFSATQIPNVNNTNQGTVVTNNIIYQGSTAELLNFMKNNSDTNNNSS